MNAKEKQELKQRQLVSRATTVYASVTVAGEAGTRSARLWDNLPGWWNSAQGDQRIDWIKAHFARQVGCKPEQVLGATARTFHAGS